MKQVSKFCEVLIEKSQEKGFVLTLIAGYNFQDDS